MKKILCLILVTLVFLAPFCFAEGSNIELERIVVTPLRAEQADYESGSNVTVIDREDIENSAAITVPDLLKSEAGVLVTGYSGNRKAVNVDIRGFGETSPSNVLLLIDGRRANQMDISGADWIQVPVEAIERIEIVRGAGSVLYGDNAVGGVVNIITKQGQGKLKGSLEAVYGSYDTKAGMTDVSGSLDSFSYFLHGKYLEKKGYRENNALRSKDFNGRFGYPVSERLDLDLSLGSHKDTYGMPGALSEAQKGDLGRRQSVYMEDRALTNDRFVRLRINADPIINDLEIGNFVNDFSLRRRKTHTSSVAWGVNTTSQNNIHSMAVNSKYEKRFYVGDHDVRLITGVDYSLADNELSGRGWSVDEIDISKESTGGYVYVENKIKDDFLFSGGYRYEKNEYIFDQSSAQVKYTKRQPSDSVYEFSLAYLYDDDSSAFCSYKQSFRFPATDEWYVNSGPNLGLNEGLEHQKGEHYEAGIKHALMDSTQLNLTAYLMNIKKEIFYNPSTYFNENYDRTRHAGIEVGANSRLTESLRVFLNYDFERAKFKKGAFNGNNIPAVPRHKFSAGLNIEPKDNCHFLLLTNYVGKRYMISDQQNQVEKMDYFITVDSKMLYKVKEIELSLAINNIFNETYSEYGVTNAAGTAKNFYPAPERNFEVGLRYQF